MMVELYWLPKSVINNLRGTSVPGISKRSTHHSMLQADLFASLSPLRTQVITRRKDFDELFDGFDRMRAISYIVENPKEFDKWLGQPPQARSLFARLFKSKGS